MVREEIPEDMPKSIVNRPDPNKSTAGISLMNGASDGAGNPDPVNANPLGSSDANITANISDSTDNPLSYNEKYKNYDPSKDRFAESNDYQSTGQQSETTAGVVSAPVATEDGEVLEAGSIPAKDEYGTVIDRDQTEEEAAAAVEAAKAAAQDALIEAALLEQKNASDLLIQQAKDKAAALEKQLQLAQEELEKAQSAFDEDISSRADRRTKTYETALDMLGKGDFNSVIENYQNRIRGYEIGDKVDEDGNPIEFRDEDGNPINPVDIDGGRPGQPTAKLKKPGELKTSTVNVSWGTDQNNNSGWGYYGTQTWVEDGVQQQQETFIITQETAAAGEDYVRDNAQIDQMEEFIERMAAAESDDARQQIMNQEMAFLNEAIADAAQLKSQANAETNIGLQADRNLEAQNAAQAFAVKEREARENFTRDYEQTFAAAQNKLGRDFTTEERLAIQVYQDATRDEERGLNREDTEAAQQFSSDQQEDSQRFTEEQANINREIAAAEAATGREFTTSERVAIENFQRIQNEASRSDANYAREDTQSFQKESRVASQEFSSAERRTSEEVARDQASTANDRAIQDREDRQVNETLQREQAQKFNIERDKIEFDRQSRLESVRLGIADATSEDGIARAVELANEARQLERSSAMLDVVERIASSGLGRQMADSGLLEQLSAEFGVDLSFLITGGLGTGGSGNAPVRVTA